MASGVILSESTKDDGGVGVDGAPGDDEDRSGSGTDSDECGRDG